MVSRSKKKPEQKVIEIDFQDLTLNFFRNKKELSQTEKKRTANQKKRLDIQQKKEQRAVKQLLRKRRKFEQAKLRELNKQRKEQLTRERQTRKILEKELKIKLKSPRRSAINKNPLSDFSIKLPSIKAPKFKLPKVPRIKAPKLPKFKIPKFKTPTIHTPEIHLPKFPTIKVPKISTPKFKLPKVPRIKAPKFKTPKMRKIKAPKFKLPKFKTPKLNLPRIHVPKFKAPRIKAPKFKLPKTPRIKAPKFKTPKINIPKLPSIHLPEISIPKFKLPKVHIPKLDLPKRSIRKKKQPKVQISKPSFKFNKITKSINNTKESFLHRLTHHTNEISKSMVEQQAISLEKARLAKQQRLPEQVQTLTAPQEEQVLTQATAEEPKLKMEEKIDARAKTRSNRYEYRERLKLGIPGFDKLFNQGIPAGSAILLEGSAGSGKTIFSLQLSYQACLMGKKVLYMSFEEPEERLLMHMKSFGWDAKSMVKKGRLRISRFNALDIARSIEALLSEAKKELLIDVQPIFFPTDFKPDIVCVDSLSSISSAFSGEQSRFRIYMEQLFKYLESRDITSFLIVERPHPVHLGNISPNEEAVSFLADGIISIYNVLYKNGKRSPGIEIYKMRGTGFDKKIVKMEIINKKGIVVYPNKVIKQSEASAFT
jgi:KaiC/GvpD/RAD55 family RecA-like ATPase